LSTPLNAGLYAGSLRPSATKSNTTSTGRSITTSPSIRTMNRSSTPDPEFA